MFRRFFSRNIIATSTDYDSRSAFCGRSTLDILRGLALLRLTSFRYFVENSERLYRTGEWIFGRKICEKILKKTFYAQFVAGADYDTLAKESQRLLTHGNVKTMLCPPMEDLEGINKNFHDMAVVNTEKFLQHLRMADVLNRMQSQQRAVVQYKLSAAFPVLCLDAFSSMIDHSGQGWEKAVNDVANSLSATGKGLDELIPSREMRQAFEMGLKNTMIIFQVITCEGNASFYELGYGTGTPLEAGYSALMWNHPGFAESTGTPWPMEETAAVDVVVQFALNQLAWNEEDIVLYGWSIGGFTASWAAMNYPKVRALILDAAFDDIVPLAMDWTPRLFSWMSTFLSHTLRSYINLPIGKQVGKFNGPVLLIRRTRDEVMAVGAKDLNDPSSMRRANRTNDLLKSLLVNRYPKLFGEEVVALIDHWLAGTEEERDLLFALHDVDTDECQTQLQNYAQQNPVNGGFFPMNIGENFDLNGRQQLALYLASRYLIDHDDTHMMPLPAYRFFVPRHPWQ